MFGCGFPCVSPCLASPPCSPCCFYGLVLERPSWVQPVVPVVVVDNDIVVGLPGEPPAFPLARY